MSDEDVESLVAFMNTLKPVRSQLAKTELNFRETSGQFTPKPVEGRMANPTRVTR